MKLLLFAAQDTNRSIDQVIMLVPDTDDLDRDYAFEQAASSIGHEVNLIATVQLGSGNQTLIDEMSEYRPYVG
jgi:hypothetical protein